MKRSKKAAEALVLFSLLLVLIPAVAFGHGWGGYEQGAKAKGMGGAFTGLANDPTAVCYNPAGIVQLDGTQGSLGFTIVHAIGSYESSGTSGMVPTYAPEESDLKSQYFFIPNLYVTSKINDSFSLGFGQYTVCGLGFKWDNDFEGRYASGGKDGAISSVTFNPVAAYKLNDVVSVAFGVRVEKIDLKLENKIFVAPGLGDVDLEITGHDYAPGWNAGILCKMSDSLSAGLCYRSKIKHTFDDSNLEFSPQVPSIDIPGVGTVPVGLTNTNADLDVTLPQYASFGLAWKQGALTVTTDVYWWDWSEVKELSFELDSPVAGSSTITGLMDWKDTWTYAIGANYDVNALNRIISLRAGFMYEECPVPDKTVGPSGYQGDNLLFNIGIGAMVGPFYSDYFISYVYTKDRTWNNASGVVANPGGGPITGEFKDYRTYLFGNNITYKF